jgi:hypothetical protein
MLYNLNALNNYLTAFIFNIKGTYKLVLRDPLLIHVLISISYKTLVKIVIRDRLLILIKH